MASLTSVDRWFNISEYEAERVWGTGYAAFQNEYGYMAGYAVSQNSKFYAY